MIVPNFSQSNGNCIFSNAHVTKAFSCKQNLVTFCVPQPCIASGNASSCTKRCRTHALTKARDMMSSGAVHAQLAHEVKAQGQSDLQKLVQELDLNQIRIPQGNFLTMKADLCLSWKKSRELKRLNFAFLERLSVAEPSYCIRKGPNVSAPNQNVVNQMHTKCGCLDQSINSKSDCNRLGQY